MYISPCVPHKDSCFTVAECISNGAFIARKVHSKLRNVYIMECSSQRKLFKSSGMYMSWSVDRKESCFKVEECIYLDVFIERKFVLKSKNVYIIHCSSQGKLF